MEEREIVNRFLNFSKGMSDSVFTDESVFETGSFSSARKKPTKKYTQEELQNKLENGSIEELREISQFFFSSSGLYRRLCANYANLLYYTPVIVPHMIGRKKKITDKKMQNLYYEALETVSDLNFEQLCRHFAICVIRDGEYFGMVKEAERHYLIQDLPNDYCRTRLKSWSGVDIIEFNVEWFDDAIKDSKVRLDTLKNFPKEVRKAYLAFSRGTKNADKWVKLPLESGIHFMMFDGRPFFSTVCPAIENVKDYTKLEKEKDQQLLYKIIVQEIEHTSNGDLVLEPEEALELHKGLTKITKNNKNLDAITSYGKVKVEDVGQEDRAQKDNLEKVSNMFYTESGVSRQLFSAQGNASLEKSIQNDISLMMGLANDFAIWLKNFLNSRFGDNKNIKFDAEILPVGQYNVKDYLSQTLNAAQYGYSFIVPAVAMGFEQSEMLDLKEVEIELLHMQEKLVPLQSSHTTSEKSGAKTKEEQKEAESRGASKEEENRSEKTIQNRESLDGGEE